MIKAMALTIPAQAWESYGLPPSCILLLKGSRGRGNVLCGDYIGLMFPDSPLTTSREEGNVL